MSLEGPSLRYARVDESIAMEPGGNLSRALRLAREIEELLEKTPSDRSRIACAMSASLIDELESLVRSARATASIPTNTRKSGTA